MNKALAIILCSLWLVGCGFNDGLAIIDDSARTTRLTDNYTIDRSTSALFARKSVFYVALPQSAPKPEIGAAFSRAVAKALANEFPAVQLAQRVESADTELRQARAASAAYLVSPTLVSWEKMQGSPHPACPNPERYKEAEVRLVIRSASDGSLVDVVRISAHSGYLSWWDDSSLELLKRPLDEVVAAMAGETR